jgi:HTH-type transcriptional regulator / antitoxin HipB
MIMHPAAIPIAQRIGAAVARERARLGLRQDELAYAAGVSTRVVHQVENGKPTSRLDSVAAVLAAVGLTLDAVVDSGLSGNGDDG